MISNVFFENPMVYGENRPDKYCSICGRPKAIMGHHMYDMAMDKVQNLYRI